MAVTTAGCTLPIAQLDKSIPCPVVKNPDGTYSAIPQPFDRVFVDYLTLGCTRVSWEINSHFREPEPWVFQLQVAEADIPSANWTNVGPPVTNTFLAIDPSQRYCGKTDGVFYRVSVTSAIGNTHYSEITPASGVLDYKNWHFAQELIRKENLRLRQLGVGQEGFLLKAKRSGTPCPVCLDPRTGEVTDSNCTICYGQRWEGGFYDAYPAYFGDINVSGKFYLNRELEQGEGMVYTQINEGEFVATPFLLMNDVFVSKTSDYRYQIHSINITTHIKGVPIIHKAELRLIPTDWIIYQFPIPGKP